VHAVLAILLMMVMAYCQNLSFTLSSRSRNRNHKGYHVFASVLSNGVWFMTMKYLVIDQGMTWTLMIPYTIATVAGSVTGQVVSERIERWLGVDK
jgi:putative flippase GtrA